MFVKLAILACSFAAAIAVYNGPLAGGQPADLYPAGVSPQACPNFPNCNNPAVAANPQQPANAWGPQSPYNAPPQNNWNSGSWNNNNNGWNGNQWNSAPVPQYGGNDVQARLNRGEYVGDGDYRGEGLAEALAPGYEGQAPNWNNGGNQYNGGNQWNPAPAGPVHGVGQIPAGVDAGACPNYPFCH